MIVYNSRLVEIVTIFYSWMDPEVSDGDGFSSLLQQKLTEATRSCSTD